MSLTVTDFISAFISKPPSDPHSRILHWAQVAQHPERFTSDKSPYAIAAKRKLARQSLRRLLAKHPDIQATFRRAQ